jgi:GntR family transcriptional regulator/MocR family aminotransferase
MQSTFTAGEIEFDELGPPRYEQLAQGIENAIREGRLKPGDRLPPVRQLAEKVGTSVTTVASAFELLSKRALIRTEVGRGTFVASLPPVPSMRSPAAPIPSLRHGERSPWRRRALMTLGAQLSALYPNAVDCSTGRPDVNLLPFRVLQRAWKSAMEKSGVAELQYSGPGIIEPLSRVLVRLLERDGIAAGCGDLLTGSSAQQLMMLSLEVATELAELAKLDRREKPAVAVEEPGYPTIMDAFERAGARLVPVSVDEQGAVPESLDTALRDNATMVLLTPRAHNPTGASWSADRRSALAAVLAEHSDVLVVEDDQFADVASTRPGSLLNEARVSDRVIYIRSFSKSIGPDLRTAVAAARPRLRTLLVEAKSFADGWTSRLLQKTLAAALEDEELPELLAQAREAYQQRRQQACEALNGLLHAHGGWTWCGPDGLNLWVHLPPGLDAVYVVERAAASGVRIASGEPFFIRPGHSNFARLNAGSVPTEKAAEAGRLAAEAILASRSSEISLIHV